MLHEQMVAEVIRFAFLCLEWGQQLKLPSGSASETGEDILKRIANDPSSPDFRSSQSEGSTTLLEMQANSTPPSNKFVIRFFDSANDPATPVFVHSASALLVTLASLLTREKIDEARQRTGDNGIPDSFPLCDVSPPGSRRFLPEVSHFSRFNRAWKTAPSAFCPKELDLSVDQNSVYKRM
jgi:hypothetical protein